MPHKKFDYKKFFTLLRGLPWFLQQRILSHAVTSKTTIVSAHNEITGESSMQMERWAKIRPFTEVWSLFYEASRLFWENNTIFVPSVAQIRSSLTIRFRQDVRRLFVILPAEIGTTFSEAAKDRLHACITRELRALTSLDALCLAVIYKDLAARKMAAARGDSLEELRMIIMAIADLSVSELALMLCNEGIQAAKMARIVVEPVPAGETVMSTLLAANAGVAVAVA